VAEVRERARIEEIVGEHVTLKSAGVGSMKGLCPFHDERSPSFHVRPQVGLWHCFGCNEGGDVISFLQKISGLSFQEAVEHLAARVGVTLRYDDGGRPSEEPGRRHRLIEAHRAAQEYFEAQLASPEAAAGRAFLAERGFDRAAAAQFGVGFAPMGWDNLLRQLRGKAYTEAELNASGLMSQGNRGMYDRFRGRLIWPIRDVTGDVIGFGARKLFEEDQGPKYLNTPETALYKKSQVLYGIDLAKREIARTRQVVVVEGYTDVMAAHLSGVTTTVATCGTAFGSEHTRLVRRLIGDTATGSGVQLASGTSTGGEVIFTFDGDAAGQKAAMRAFGEDQQFSAQTFVAVEPSGMDPCELRQAKGPEAVRALVAGRQPLFEFVIRTTLRSHDLETAEGRVAALRSAAPIVAGIRDAALRPEYARMLAGWLGMESDAVRRAVAAAGKGGAAVRSSGPGSGATGEREGQRGRAGSPMAAAPNGSGAAGRPDPRDRIAQLERQALEVALQLPDKVDAGMFDSLGADAFQVPMYRAVHEAIRAAGGLGARPDGGAARWVESVREAAAEAAEPAVTELAVAPLQEDRVSALDDYVTGVVRSLVDLGITREIANARGRLQRMDPEAEPEAYQAAFAALVALEGRRRALRVEDD